MQELRLRAARTACARSQVTWLRDRLLKRGSTSTARSAAGSASAALDAAPRRGGTAPRGRARRIARAAPTCFGRHGPLRRRGCRCSTLASVMPPRSAAQTPAPLAGGDVRDPFLRRSRGRIWTFVNNAGLKLLNALKELGFELDDELTATILTGHDWIQLRGPVDIDIVFAPDGIKRYEDARNRAKQIDGHRVCALEDVIRSKEAANRRKDLESLPRLRNFKVFIDQQPPRDLKPLPRRRESRNILFQESAEQHNVSTDGETPAERPSAADWAVEIAEAHKKRKRLEKPSAYDPGDNKPGGRNR